MIRDTWYVMIQFGVLACVGIKNQRSITIQCNFRHGSVKQFVVGVISCSSCVKRERRKRRQE